MKLLKTVSIQLLFTFLCLSCFVKCLHHFFSTFPMGVLKINDVTGGNALQPCINLTLQHECVSEQLLLAKGSNNEATAQKVTQVSELKAAVKNSNSKFACRWAIPSHFLLNQVGPMLHGL